MGLLVGFRNQALMEYEEDLRPFIHKIRRTLRTEVNLTTIKKLLVKPGFCLAVVFLIWGASVPIAKTALREIGPASFLFLRMVIACLALFPFVFKSQSKFKSRDEMNIFLAALSGVGLHIYLIYLALPSVSSVNVPIINALSPFLLVFLGWIFLKEKIHRRKYFGMFFGFFGVIVITVIPSLGVNTDVLGVYSHIKLSPLAGDLVIFVSAVFGVLGTMLVKSIKQISSLTITFWQSAVVAIAILPFAIMEIPSEFIPTISPAVIVALLFTGILNSAVGYTLYNHYIHKLQTTDIGLLSYLSPIGALLFAIPLLGEFPDIWFVIGSVLILYGVWVAEKKKSTSF
jgi:drug/metabolite transporter (DMT)-like permease